MHIRSSRITTWAVVASGIAAAALGGCTRPAPEAAAAASAQPEPVGRPAPLAAARPLPAAEAGAEGPGKVLARVNGVALTEEDVRLALRLGSAQEPIPAEKQAPVLESLIREELIAQRAASLGMEQNHSYLVEKAKMDAQMQAMRRRALGDLYFKTEIEAKVAVDDAAVQRYFEANKTRLATELHVQQILVRRDSEAFAAVEKLKAGKSFAEVAREGFATVPDEKAPPWDLGWLRWRQIPEPWREVVYDLAPGQPSGVIAGPRGRHWVVQVVARRTAEKVSLDELRPQILEELKAQQLEASRAALDAEIRRGARIER